jgi:hypothetical protein
MLKIENYLFSGLVMLLLAVMLNACGGGTAKSSNNGIGGGGTAVGTVTGFGSIFVNGQEYPETLNTRYKTEIYGAASGVAANGIQLGQNVSLSLDANGNISLVSVVPDVQGTVSSINSSVLLGSGASASSVPALTVASVLIVTNTDSSQGPVTTYGGGYTALADVKVGDNVDIHGLLLSANGIDYIQATYLGKQPNFLGTRVTGTVANFNPASNTFTLGSGSSAITISSNNATSLVPGGAVLSNGEVVNVWSNSTLTNNTLTATLIKVRRNLAATSQTLSVSGGISGYVSQASFIVNGVTVDASGITLPTDILTLSNGMVVAVSGTINSNGTLVATQLKVFKSRVNLAPPVNLQGTISDFVSAANFTVRGVVVDASQSPTFNSGYNATNLQNGAYVKIKGTLSNNSVVATAINFVSVPATSVVDLIALVQGYDSTKGVLTATLKIPGANSSQTLAVTLDSSVTYINGTVSSLIAGQTIEIHAIYNLTTNSFGISSVTFLPPPPSVNQVRLKGVVTAVSPTGGTVTSFVVNGLTILVGSANIVAPNGSSATLSVGDRAAITAQVSSGNVLTALKILDSPASIRGW